MVSIRWVLLAAYGREKPQTQIRYWSIRYVCKYVYQLVLSWIKCIYNYGVVMHGFLYVAVVLLYTMLAAFLAYVGVRVVATSRRTRAIRILCFLVAVLALVIAAIVAFFL